MTGKELRPDLDRRDKLGKRLLGTVGFALLSAALAGGMARLRENKKRYGRQSI